MAPHHQAYVEDASESSDGGHQSRKANAAVKRTSHSSDLDRNNAHARQPDLQSDSGYSSRTAATKSSADSAKSSRDRRGPPVKPEIPLPVPDAPASAKVRPKLADNPKRRSIQGRETSRPSKPTTKSSKNPKPVVVRQSSTRERAASEIRPRRDTGACQDPHCDECMAKSRARLPPLNTGMDSNYLSYGSQSPRIPPSPSRAPYGPDYPLIQTQIAGSTRPRLYSQGRPTTYHGGSALSDRYNYNPSGSAYGSRPPPTLYNSQYAAMMGSTPSTGFYGRVPPQSPLGASFDGRPSMPRGISEGYTPRAPQGQQNDPRSLPNPRYAPPGSTALTVQPYQEEFSDEEDDNGYYPYEQAEIDRRAMPPPSRLPAERPGRRPSLRSQTTGNIRKARPASVGYDNHEDYDEELAALTQSLQIPARASSVRRQSASSDRRAYYNTSAREERVVIQPSRSDRPRESEQERTRRNTIYNKTVVPELRLDSENLDREAKADGRKRGKLESKVSKVEAYLNSMSPGYGATVDNLRTNAARGRPSSNAARTRASSHSQNSHDDASRVSDGSRSNATRKTIKGGDMTIRLDGDDMTFEGDLGGKIVKFANGEDGNHQIIIADTRGRENRYLMDQTGSRVTTNTSSSRSRSDRDGMRPRANSRSGYERDSERDQRERLDQRAINQRRRVSYVDESNRPRFSQ